MSPFAERHLVGWILEWLVHHPDFWTFAQLQRSHFVKCFSHILLVLELRDNLQETIGTPIFWCYNALFLVDFSLNQSIDLGGIGNPWIWTLDIGKWSSTSWLPSLMTLSGPFFFFNPYHPRSLRLEVIFSVTSCRDWKWWAWGILGIYPEMAKILRWNTDISMSRSWVGGIRNEAASFRHWAYKPQTLNLFFLQDIMVINIYIYIYI